MLTDVFIFGVTTGQEAYPAAWADAARKFYADASAQPPKLMIYDRIGENWVVSFICYRFIGSGGRANSHFGVALVFDKEVDVSHRKLWELFSGFFDFLEKTKKIYVREKEGDEYLKFVEVSFTQIDSLWLENILDQLRFHARKVDGLKIGLALCPVSTGEVSILSLADSTGTIVDSLMLNGRCMISEEKSPLSLSIEQKENEIHHLKLQLEKEVRCRSNLILEKEKELLQVETELKNRISDVSKLLRDKDVEIFNLKQQLMKKEADTVPEQNDNAHNSINSGQRRKKWPMRLLPSFLMRRGDPVDIQNNKTKKFIFLKQVIIPSFGLILIGVLAYLLLTIVENMVHPGGAAPNDDDATIMAAAAVIDSGDAAGSAASDSLHLPLLEVVKNENTSSFFLSTTIHFFEEVRAYDKAERLVRLTYAVKEWNQEKYRQNNFECISSDDINDSQLSEKIRQYNRQDSAAFLSEGSWNSIKKPTLLLYKIDSTYKHQKQACQSE